MTPLGHNLHKAFAARLGDAAAKAQARADRAQRTSTATPTQTWTEG